jgi:hypothetical protein
MVAYELPEKYDFYMVHYYVKIGVLKCKSISLHD